MCIVQCILRNVLCKGWSGNTVMQLDLWITTSDRTQRFIEDSNILRMQKEFTENECSSDQPFLNIFNKGYQCVLPALNKGQECMQPTFAESDEQLNDRAVLYSTAVAVVRSENKRAVNRCKMSWLIKHGTVDGMYNTEFCCDIWDAFTFQINFMYEKYL